MKLLLVNYEFPPVGGGAANATAFLARALAEQGHAVTVLTTAFAKHRGATRQDGYDVVRVRTFRRSADRSNPIEMASFLLGGLLPALRLARRVRFDATIGFFTIPSGPIAWLLRRTLGIPYLVSLRGGDVPGFVPEIDAIHRLIAPLRRAVLRNARAVVANSASLARLSESADPFPVAVIPNGVDPALFAPAATDGRAMAREFRMLFVGRLHTQKNVEALIESAAALLALPGPPIALEIVGDGPERAALASLAQRSGAARVLQWRGWLAKPDVIASLHRAHVFVNPSRYEGMPNTVLEAMAAALPVVASRVGGNDDLVADGATGFLFELAEPQRMTAALQQLRLDPELGATLGARGRERVVADFGWPSVAMRYAALIESRAAR